MPVPPPEPAVFRPQPSPGTAHSLPVAKAEAAAEPVPSSPAIDWERWLGVRGAAALGAGILVIALLFFLRYSADRGWLTLTLRVVMGAGFSAACLAVARLRFRTTHVTLSSWLTGAGFAGLFASVWAAQHVAEIVGPFAAFTLVLLLAAGCVVAALHDDSMPIAMLALVGAAAAPLSISAASRPVATAVFVGLLDVVMIGLAVRKRWWGLLGLTMLTTAAYEAAWLILSPSSAAHTALHVAVILVFAGLFGALPTLAPFRPKDNVSTPSELAVVARYGALLLPYAFALKLAVDPALWHSPIAIGTVVLSLSSLAAIQSWQNKTSSFVGLALMGNTVILGAWATGGGLARDPYTVAAMLVLLVAPFGSAAIATRHDKTVFLFGASLFVSALVLVGAAALTTAAVPVAMVALTLLALAGTALGLTLGSTALVRATVTTFPLWICATGELGSSSMVVPSWIVGILGLATTAALGFLAKAEPMRIALHRSSRTGALLILPFLLVFTPYASTPVFVLMLASICAVSLVSIRSDFGLYAVFVSAAVTALGIFAWFHAPLDLAITVGIVGAMFVGLAFAPSLLGRIGLVPGFAQSAFVPFGQSVALTLLPLVFIPSSGALRTEPMGIVGVVTALIALGLLVSYERKDSSQRTVAGTCLGLVMVVAATAAIFLELHGAPRICALALLGVGLVGLERGLQHDTLGGSGLVLLLVTSLHLLDPHVIALHPRGAVPIFNWILPTFLVPVAACAGAWALRPRGSASRVFAATMSLVGLFVWCNVCVLDVYGTGTYLSLSEPASESRGLAISLVWGLFGVGLLVGGVLRDRGALRWASLALILGTAGKVFLYDLSSLQDLYRVGALLGLAASLLAISILYQRFVFRKGPAAPPRPCAAEPPVSISNP